MRAWLIALGPAVALSGCASLTASSLATPTARGEAVAARVCAACHALGAGGDSANPRAPAFASLEMQHTAGLPGRVADLTRTGHYGMPPVALTPQEVTDVAAYIESLGGSRPKRGPDA